MAEKEDFILESIVKMGESHSEEMKQGMDALIGNFMKGMMPKDALGIGDKNTEALYADAYHLYNIGQYEEAKKIFVTLCMLDPLDARFPFGIAASCHMMEDYERAAQWYFKTSLFDADNPIPHYHASDCHLRLNDPVSALASLRITVDRCGNNTAYQIIKERAEMTINNLITMNMEENKSTESLKNEEGPQLNKIK